MAGCKRKLGELGDDDDFSVKQSRLSPSAYPNVSEHLGLATSRSGLQDGSTTTRHAGTNRSYLALLPAEILLNVFPRCRNPCLSHVSSRLHQILPAFRGVSKSLAGFAMAALPYTDGDGRPADLRHLPIWQVACKLYSSSWISPPDTFQERLAIQKEVFESCWFGFFHFRTIHFLTQHDVMLKVFMEDSCIRYREENPSITAQQRFNLSYNQLSRIRGSIRFQTSLGVLELGLRTKTASNHTLHIKLECNNISFRTGKTPCEIYTINSISHTPSFVYDLPVHHRTSDMLRIISNDFRGTGLQCDSAVNEVERRVFCSCDKLRKTFNRVLEAEAA